MKIRSWQWVIGRMYGNNWGGAQDYAEAVKWYRLGAEQGNASAQFALGFMYREGRGVTQDYVRAHMWYIAPGREGSQLSAPPPKLVSTQTANGGGEGQPLAA